VYSRVVRSLIIATFFGLVIKKSKNPFLTPLQVFLQVDDNQTSIQNRQGAILFFLMVASLLPATFQATTFPIEKKLVAHETLNNMYRITSYYFAKVPPKTLSISLTRI